MWGLITLITLFAPREVLAIAFALDGTSVVDGLYGCMGI
jgi:hypothetical protein